MQSPALTNPVIDGLDFLPKSLWESAGSPLHLFHGLKQDYIAELNDPIVQWTPETASGHDSWMGLFVYFELALALPVMLFTVYRLGIKRQGTSGAHELALMVYGFEAAFTTAIAMHDVFYWDNTVYTAAQKNKLLSQMYLPWLIVRKFHSVPFGCLEMVAERIASLMFVTMARRILARIRVADAALAAKKGQ